VQEILLLANRITLSGGVWDVDSSDVYSARPFRSVISLGHPRQGAIVDLFTKSGGGKFVVARCIASTLLYDEGGGSSQVLVGDIYLL
jgi:hypothetical protein